MKFLKGLSTLILFLSLTEALICWQCENQPNNKACVENGRAVRCAANENSCQNEIRRGVYGVLITKSCKQPQACESNLLSLSLKWWPDGMLCNTRALNSVCRCCCNTNNCNKATIGCKTPNTITTTTTTTTESEITTAVSTSSPMVVTTIPRNPTPNRPPPSCDDIEPPSHGGKVCSPGKNKLDKYDIEIECEFFCEEGFVLEGSPTTSCVRIGDTDEAKFDRPPPQCRRCETLPPIPNGEVACSTDKNQVCFFECNTDYSLYPPEAATTTCMNNSEWSNPPPCCLRNCPPHAYMDMVILLDSSPSVGDEGFKFMRGIAKNIIESFDVGSSAARFSVVAYNSDVDRASQILFRDYPNDKRKLLAAVEDIPYNGKGLRDTGLALEYAQNFLMRTSSGDRRAPNVVLVITNGEAYDDETVYISSLSLRQEGVHTFAVGVLPTPPSQLNFEQLSLIGGSAQNVFITDEETRSNVIDQALVKRIGRQVCGMRTCETELNLNNLLKRLNQELSSSK